MIQPDDLLPALSSTDAATTDPWVVRIVAAGLVLLAVLILGGLVAVAAFATGLPPEARAAALVTAGAGATTAVGAAAALLASTRSRA